MAESLPTSEKMVLTERESLELVAFLLSSSRIQLDEPLHYASMRLLSAAEKTAEFLEGRVSTAGEKLLDEVNQLIAHAHIEILNEDEYKATLDTLNRLVARFLVDLSGLEESA